MGEMESNNQLDFDAETLMHCSEYTHSRDCVY